MIYIPKRVFFEEDSLNYSLGQKLYSHFNSINIETKILKSHNRVTEIPGSTPQESYIEGKNTLVVGIRKTLNFESCKPSAHYQLPLTTSCAGKCEYCYLNTQLGKKPYLRVYVNIDEILNKTKTYIDKNAPNITIFEGAATSDPLITEPYTNSLFEIINFFGKEEFGKFRFVTKFTNVETLLNTKHNNNTEIRFSINTHNVIKKYEHATPNLDQRIDASYKLLEAGYNIGFIIAPVFFYDGWNNDYLEMLKTLHDKLINYKNEPIGFEIISHRYTEKAKNIIKNVFPNTTLPMDKQDRIYKYGQFGYGKYVYSKDILNNINSFFTSNIQFLFPNSQIKYII